MRVLAPDVPLKARASIIKRCSKPCHTVRSGDGNHAVGAISASLGCSGRAWSSTKPLGVIILVRCGSAAWTYAILFYFSVSFSPLWIGRPLTPPRTPTRYLTPLYYRNLCDFRPLCILLPHCLHTRFTTRRASIGVLPLYSRNSFRPGHNHLSLPNTTAIHLMALCMESCQDNIHRSL